MATIIAFNVGKTKKKKTFKEYLSILTESWILKDMINL